MAVGMVKGSEQARGAGPDSRQLSWGGCDPWQKWAYGQDSGSLGAGVFRGLGDGVEGEAEHRRGAGIGLDLWDRLGLRVTGDIFMHLIGSC